MTGILCILDMRPNVHYTLERLPSIKRALADKEVIYLNIYDFEGQFGKYRGPDRINQLFVDYIKAKNIDIIFTSSEIFKFISVCTISKLITKGLVISSVLGDDENNYYININYLGLLTVPVAYQKREHEKYLEVNPNTYLLPISASMYGTENFLNSQKTRDVIFIGKAYGDRPKLLQYLHKHGIRLEIFGGPKWKKYFRNDVYKGFVNNSDYYFEIAKSKIVLALLESPKNPKLLHVNAKPFDAAKTGVALIATKYKTFFEDYGFKDKRDLYSYTSKEELLVSIKFLLENEEKRQEIANNFREQITNNYDYDFLYRELFYFLTLSKFDRSEIRPARVLFVKRKSEFSRQKIKDFDFIIIQRRGVKYSESIKYVLTAHLKSNKFVKLDTYYKGRVARKIFNFVDTASLVIPIARFSEVNSFFGITKVPSKDSMQSYIPLNRYIKFNLYISCLIFLKSIYKKISS
jgi:hypothetical protein